LPVDVTGGPWGSPVTNFEAENKKTATPIDRPKNRGSRWVWPLVTVHEGHSFN
jgi:hypothetical protein